MRHLRAGHHRTASAVIASWPPAGGGRPALNETAAMHGPHVMPTKSLPRAKAGVGIHDFAAPSKEKSWIPAFAGMTWAAISAGCFLRVGHRPAAADPP